MKMLLYSADRGAAPERELYEGLKRALGSKNVTLYKPKVYGHTTEHTLPAGALDSSELRERIDEFDCIFMFYSSFPDKDFEYVLNKRNGSTKIFVDGVDDFFVRRIYNHPEIKYYLKRELYRTRPTLPYSAVWGARYLYEMAHIELNINYKWIFSKWAGIVGTAWKDGYRKMRPFPLMIVPKGARTAAKREYDLSFMGHINSMDRLTYANAAESIGKHLGLRVYVSRDYFNPKPALSKEEYLKVLSSSKAGLSTRGIGYDTYRYWEIPCYGSMLISQRLPIVIPDDFVEGESALYFSSREELESKVEKYLMKSDEWREIERNGQRHFFRHHTPEERVKRLVLNLIKE